MKTSKGSRLIALMMVVLFPIVANAKKYVSGNTNFKGNITEAKATIEIILNNPEICSICSGQIPNTGIVFKKIRVFDYGIEISSDNFNRLIYFSVLLKGIEPLAQKGMFPVGNAWFAIDLGKGVSLWLLLKKKFKEKNEELADALDYMQQYQKQILIKQDSMLTAFKSLAEQYRSQKIKPSLSEEQRKYIVQANFFNQQKDFEKATELYKKVIEIDQTAYPAAYYNLALLFAQLNNFSTAIFYMQEYLLLEPEAQDARAAQDKIYEWETMMEK